MLRGVLAYCADCREECLFVPLDEAKETGEHCCTACDAAVFMLEVVDNTAPTRARSRVA